MISSSRSPDLFGLDIDSGPSSLTVQRLSRLVQQLGERNEIIKEEKPLALKVKTQTEDHVINAVKYRNERKYQ